MNGDSVLSLREQVERLLADQARDEHGSTPWTGGYCTAMRRVLALMEGGCPIDFGSGTQIKNSGRIFRVNGQGGNATYYHCSFDLVEQGTTCPQCGEHWPTKFDLTEHLERWCRGTIQEVQL